MCSSVILLNISLIKSLLSLKPLNDFQFDSSLRDLTSYCFYHILLLTKYALTILYAAPLKFRHILTSGTLHWLFPLPQMLFPQMYTWITYLFPHDLHWPPHLNYIPSTGIHNVICFFYSTSQIKYFKICLFIILVIYCQNYSTRI